MAVEIGTASGHIDLLNKLVTFLTTNAELVSLGQNWDVMSTQSSNEPSDGGAVYYLRGPGLAGQDAIHVQMFTRSNPAADWYNIRIHGAAGFNPDSVPLYTGQPGYLDTNVSMLLWNQATPYWFIANGRRFIVVAKVSTVYQSCYAGFILPLAPPSEFPYPLAIGGMLNGDARWSSDHGSHLSFTNPNNTLYLLRPDLTWLGFQNYSAGSGNFLNGVANHNVWPTRIRTTARPAPDGTYALTPLVLRTNASGGNVYGELDGVRSISGFGNASENIQVINGVSWLTVQDGFRTTENHYFAVALE